MKKSLILLFFTLYTFNYSIGQDFGQLGSEWYFNGNQDGPCPGVCSYVHIESVEDSTINGKTCHKLLSKHKWHQDIVQEYTYPAMFVHEQSDSVFLWSPNRQNFLLLYIFNVNAGDTLTLDIPLFIDSNPSGDSIYQMVIDSVTNSILDGQIIKTYNFSSNTVVGFGNTYMDKIGNLSWFFPRNGMILEAGYGLRCYSDSQIDTSLVSFPCDSLWNMFSSINNYNWIDKIKVFPNPTNSSISIFTKGMNATECTIKIFNLHGNINMQAETNQPSQTLDVSDLKPGLYIYEIESKGHFHRDKLIIE